MSTDDLFKVPDAAFNFFYERISLESGHEKFLSREEYTHIVHLLIQSGHYNNINDKKPDFTEPMNVVLKIIRESVHTRIKKIRASEKIAEDKEDFDRSDELMDLKIEAENWLRNVVLELIEVFQDHTLMAMLADIEKILIGRM